MAKLKDPFCSVSHWIGFGLAVVGSAYLFATSGGAPLKIVAFTLYAIGMLSMFGSSATYHSIHSGTGWWKTTGLQKLDHCAIYLMISGTYTPICLLGLKGPIGTWMMIAQGLFALTGIVLTFALKKVPGLIRTILYLVMGWMAVAALPALHSAFPPAAIGWLLAGGIIYSVGAVVYVTNWPNLVPGKFTAHDLWHLFVLGGAICHFILIAQFLSGPVAA